MDCEEEFEPALPVTWMRCASCLVGEGREVAERLGYIMGQPIIKALGRWADLVSVSRLDSRRRDDTLNKIPKRDVVSALAEFAAISWDDVRELVAFWARPQKQHNSLHVGIALPLERDDIGVVRGLRYRSLPIFGVPPRSSRCFYQSPPELGPKPFEPPQEKLLKH